MRQAAAYALEHPDEFALGTASLKGRLIEMEPSLPNRIAGKPSLTIDLDEGLAIERVIHAIARSHREGRRQNP
jgi:hypothetical protein